MCKLQLNYLQYTSGSDHNVLLLYRPLMISTEEFGKMWLTLSNDVKEKIQISGPQQSLSEVLLGVQQVLNFYVVEVIGK